ncbi:MAG: hypothetical protein ABSE50_11370 [Xanthobacteraceae bacterium]|jgi:hypothetical protein
MSYETQGEGRIGRLGRSIATTVAALSASVSLVMTPTKASAFDIGGMIGTAMAIQMQMNANRGAYAGGYHARVHVSNHDNDSDNRGSSNSGGGERDARDAETVDRASRSDNRLAMHRQVLGPSGTSDGLEQASERDALADQGPASGRAFNDRPSFSPSR